MDDGVILGGACRGRLSRQVHIQLLVIRYLPLRTIAVHKLSWGTSELLIEVRQLDKTIVRAVIPTVQQVHIHYRIMNLQHYFELAQDIAILVEVLANLGSRGEDRGGGGIVELGLYRCVV